MHDLFPLHNDLTVLRGRLIGFAGLARSGKDTAGSFVSQFLPRMKLIAHAEPLKAIVNYLWDFTPDQDKDTVDPRYKVTPRDPYQRVGQALREIRGDVWADVALRRAASLIAHPRVVRPDDGGFQASWFVDTTEYVGITDVRYMNELHAVRDAGGIVIRVERDGSGLKGAAGKHPSEQDMRRPQFKRLCYDTVYNNGTLADFERKLRAVITDAREHGALV